MTLADFATGVEWFDVPVYLLGAYSLGCLTGQLFNGIYRWARK